MRVVAEAYAEPEENECIIHGVDELNVLIDDALNNPDQQFSKLIRIYIAEESRPYRDNGLPDHEFSIGLNPATRVGSLAYGYMTDQFGGMWFSKGERVNPEGVSYSNYGEPANFPADSELPLELVRQAATEFLITAGERPTCIEWQPADDMTPQR